MNRAFIPDSNDSWKRTVVFNNVYGWHYSNLPVAGHLALRRHRRSTGSVALVDPFMRTIDAAEGIAEIALQFESSSAPWSGTLNATIAPENFDGKQVSFSKIAFAPTRPRIPAICALEIPDAKYGGLWIWVNSPCTRSRSRSRRMMAAPPMSILSTLACARSRWRRSRAVLSPNATTGPLSSMAYLCSSKARIGARLMHAAGFLSRTL